MCAKILLLLHNYNHILWSPYVHISVDMPLERKTPVAYPDSVFEIVREESRGNVLLISNITQHGLSGRGSALRTAFFTFFGT